MSAHPQPSYADLVTLTEAAESLHLPRTTVRHWVDHGRVPSWRRGPKILCVRLADLDAMLTPREPAP